MVWRQWALRACQEKTSGSIVSKHFESWCFKRGPGLLALQILHRGMAIAKFCHSPVQDLESEKAWPPLGNSIGRESEAWEGRGHKDPKGERGAWTPGGSQGRRGKRAGALRSLSVVRSLRKGIQRRKELWRPNSLQSKRHSKKPKPAYGRRGFFFWIGQLFQLHKTTQAF